MQIPSQQAKMVSAAAPRAKAVATATTTTTSILATISLVSLLLLLLISTKCQPANARYLPTRADDSDVEVLKDLIRGLLIQSQLDASQDARWNQAAQFDTVNRPRPLFSTARHQQPGVIQLTRRSLEIPEGSDGDTLIRTTGN